MTDDEVLALLTDDERTQWRGAVPKGKHIGLPWTMDLLRTVAAQRRTVAERAFITPLVTREECVEAGGDAELLFADGFDEAILGVAQRFNDLFVVYDKQKVLNIMVKRDGMTPEEAMEFFDFNIVGAFVGPCTPAFVEVFDRPKG